MTIDNVEHVLLKDDPMRRLIVPKGHTINVQVDSTNGEPFYVSFDVDDLDHKDVTWRFTIPFANVARITQRVTA